MVDYEYLRKRSTDLEAYYRERCEALACMDSAAGKVVLSYKKLNQGIDDVEEQSLKLLRANGLVE